MKDGGGGQDTLLCRQEPGHSLEGGWVGGGGVKEGGGGRTPCSVDKSQVTAWKGGG